ncbi:hypothetical protein M514_04678 [Trichuris suis]|uniref:Uncharacterized protein n=1 Tax=Trichuris suis TaxID=68888 RepID=A0A085MBD5_9BILA|nr:hypothetical protein M513_04678 [Trichuris suis]KFD64124.1 hypothetical protein M514_04678 [Trichuris suis]
MSEGHRRRLFLRAHAISINFPEEAAEVCVLSVWCSPVAQQPTTSCHFSDEEHLSTVWLNRVILCGSTPDTAPTYYDLLHSMQRSPSGQRFKEFEGCGSFFGSKPRPFYSTGNH